MFISYLLQVADSKSDEANLFVQFESAETIEGGSLKLFSTLTNTHYKLLLFERATVSRNRRRL
jgi:hypothetical protein